MGSRLPHTVGHTRASQRIYFDCHALIGQRPLKPIRAGWSTEHLLEDMDLAKVSGALICHGVARSYDANWLDSIDRDRAIARIFGARPIQEPNILFILADQQRADTIHAAGNRYIRTPKMDRL